MIMQSYRLYQPRYPLTRQNFGNVGGGVGHHRSATVDTRVSNHIEKVTNITRIEEKPTNGVSIFTYMGRFSKLLKELPIKL